MKIKPIISPRSGEAVRNQFVIIDDNATYFQSYESVVAKLEINELHIDKLILGRDWDYSNTTLRWLYVFLNDYVPRYYYYIERNYGKLCKANIEKAIKDGIIIYDEEMK